MADNNITISVQRDMSPSAYVKLKGVVEELKKNMDDAETDPEYLAYKEAWNVLNKRYAKATELITAAERREASRSAQKPSQRNGNNSNGTAATSA